MKSAMLLMQIYLVGEGGVELVFIHFSKLHLAYSLTQPHTKKKSDEKKYWKITAKRGVLITPRRRRLISHTYLWAGGFHFSAIP